MRFLIIISIFLLASCVTENKMEKTCAKCPSKIEKIIEVKDSAWFFTDTVKVPTYISVPGPTIMIPGPCDKLCDEHGKLKKFYQEGNSNGIKSKLFTDTLKNTLIDECDADSLKLELTKITNERDRLIREKTSTLETKTVEINKLTTWQKNMIHSAYVFWIVVLIFIGYHLFKIYKKLKP